VKKLEFKKKTKKYCRKKTQLYK